MAKTKKSQKRQIFDQLKKNGVLKKSLAYKDYKGTKQDLIEIAAYSTDLLC